MWLDLAMLPLFVITHWPDLVRMHFGLQTWAWKR